MGNAIAYQGSMTQHGGVVTQGSDFVKVNGIPVALLGHDHKCPMVTGNTPHVGGPILPPCSTLVNVGGKPVARVGDKAQCNGPPDTIAVGMNFVMVD